MARSFAVLNQNALGPTLEIELGGLVVTSNANGTDRNRTARATYGNRASTMFFEVAFYGDAAMAANLCYVGLCKGNHSLSQYVGRSANSWGYNVGGTGIYNNDAQAVATTTAAAKEMYIGVYVNFSNPSAPVATWLVNGSPIGSATLAAGTWYPAISLGCTTAYDMRAFVNFGQRTFAYPYFDPNSGEKVPVAGVYVDTASPSPIYLCPTEDGGFQTRATDSIPIITFQPSILKADTFTIGRRNYVWMFGNKSEGATFGTIEIDNVDGTYDRLLTEDWRDQPVLIMEVERGAAYNDARVLASVIVDKIEPRGETSIVLSFKDKVTTLERPVQRMLHPPFADEGIANTPVAITLGACRNIPVPLINQAQRLFSLADDAVTNIAAMRDKGALLNPNYSPPQYTPSNNLRNVILETLPQGLLTADVSSEGPQVVIPGADDVLAGAGQFDNWTVGPPTPPTGWQTGGNVSTFTRPTVPAPQNYAVGLSTPDTYNPTGVSGQDGAWLETTTAILQPGKTYRINFKLLNTQGTASPVTGGMNWGLMVRSDVTTNSAFGAISPNMQPLQAPAWGSQSASYTFVYTVPPGAARKLYFIACASTGTVGTGFGFGSVSFYGVRVELLGDVVQELPLQSITLENYMHEILEARAGLTAADWVPQDCIDIDDETGYRFGVHIKDVATVRAAIDAPLDSFCASQFTDNEGRLRIRRFRDPDTVADVDVVAEWSGLEAAYNVGSTPDYAPGLTSTAGARRNWKQYTDSDFVTDYFAVPAAFRTQLKRPSQFLVVASGSAAPSYLHAINAPPLDTVLDDPTQAQAEIDLRMLPYTAGRMRQNTQVVTGPRFVTFTVYYEGFAPAIFFGDVVKLTYPRFGLNAGKKLIVLETTLNPVTKQLTLRTWRGD